MCENMANVENIKTAMIMANLLMKAWRSNDNGNKLNQ